MRVFAPARASLNGVLRSAAACAALLGFAIGAHAQTVQAGSITGKPGAGGVSARVETR